MIAMLMYGVEGGRTSRLILFPNTLSMSLEIHWDGLLWAYSELSNQNVSY